MKVKFTKEDYTGKIASNRKEKAFSRQLTVVAISGGEILTPITARIYSTNGRHYACVWAGGNLGRKERKRVYVCGGGYAGGYGYHRASAALQCAFDDAGIVLDQNISGHGDGAMSDALLAIASTLGFRHAKVIEAHA